jgi:hypothetical protein
MRDHWDTKRYPILKVARWLETTTLEELSEHLRDLLEKNADRISTVQAILIKPIPATSGDDVREMFIALDSYQYAINAVLAEAEALLDKAQLYCLLPCGSSAVCFDEATGKPLPATGCKITNHEDPQFIPKYKELTENDRKTRQDADVAAFRRFRNELKAMSEAITSRIFNLKGLARLDASP